MGWASRRKDCRSCFHKILNRDRPSTVELITNKYTFPASWREYSFRRQVLQLVTVCFVTLWDEPSIHRNCHHWPQHRDIGHMGLIWKHGRQTATNDSANATVVIDHKATAHPMLELRIDLKARKVVHALISAAPIVLSDNSGGYRAIKVQLYVLKFPLGVNAGAVKANIVKTKSPYSCTDQRGIKRHRDCFPLLVTISIFIKRFQPDYCYVGMC
jgi:hypothetical protein